MSTRNCSTPLTVGLLALVSLGGEAGEAQSIPDDEVVWLHGTPDTAGIRVGTVVVRTPDHHYLVGSLDSRGQWAEFGPEGDFRALHGRRGEGPGEFGEIRALIPVDTNHVVVASNSRYTLMTRDGSYVDSRPGPVAPGRYMNDATFVFPEASGVHRVETTRGADGLVVAVERFSNLPYRGAGRIPTVDTERDVIASVDAEGNGYVDGEPAGWNVAAGTTTAVDFDDPAQSVVSMIVSGGKLEFSVRLYGFLGEPRFFGDAVPQDIRLWDHRGAEPVEVRLPAGTVPFITGSVIGLVYRDRYGVTRVGVLRHGTKSIQTGGVR